MNNDLCPKCGYDHARLGVTISGGQLTRRAIGSRHLIRRAGGAWGFSAKLLEAHTADVQRFLIIDTEGAFYRCTAKEFSEHAERITLDPASGPQWVLPLRFWRVTGAPRSQPSTPGPAASSSAPVRPAPAPARDDLPAQQERFDLHLPGASWFKPASAPRPRREQRRGR